MQSITKFIVVYAYSVFCIVLTQAEAQENSLPTVSANGTITSPAKNSKSKTTTNVQQINDSGATGQSVTTVRQSGSGSSGDISVTTTNTINGDLTATGGTTVRVGDVNLSGSNVGTATVRTTTNMKGGDFKDGGTHEFGVVDLMNLEAGKVEIKIESNLQGNVKTKNNSSVSVGGVNVGNEAKQQEFEQNRGNMTANSRPNNLGLKSKNNSYKNLAQEFLQGTISLDEVSQILNKIPSPDPFSEFTQALLDLIWADTISISADITQVNMVDLAKARPKLTSLSEYVNESNKAAKLSKAAEFVDGALFILTGLIESADYLDKKINKPLRDYDLNDWSIVMADIAMLGPNGITATGRSIAHSLVNLSALMNGGSTPGFDDEIHSAIDEWRIDGDEVVNLIKKSPDAGKIIERNTIPRVRDEDRAIY